MTTQKRWGVILTLYLLGIFMGALDTGIVTPARTVIQNNLGVSETTGIWMITIYTLAYAAAIPVMGKLADMFGKKKLYLIAIFLFGLGSFGCGLAQDVSSFGVLLAARVVQAIGGGGIVPIATAAVGIFVPPEKRGMALGLVGGVYGIANVFGASAGSLILNIAGIDNWQWVFYINIPIALVVIVLGVKFLPADTEEHAGKKTDYLGIAIMVIAITCLLWAIQHLDFFALGETLTDPDVYGSFLVAFVLLPVFVIVERRAEDPVIDFTYFATREVGITLLLAALSGVVLMGVVFVPQFAENSMRLATGNGGYPVIILGFASGIGAPMSGKFTDKYGPRAVVAVGAGITVLAALALNLWAAPHPGYVSTIVCLILMGLGLGFLVGAPLNYLMLHLIPESQATTGLANLSLVRAIGTTLAPAILVGLLANSLSGLSTTVMEALPAPPVPAAVMQGESASLPPELVDTLRTADVTTIVDRSKEVATYMFNEQGGAIPPQALEAYLAEIDARAPQIEETFQLEVNKGFRNLFWFYGASALAMLVLLWGVPSKREFDRRKQQA
ncbi:MAG: MFS transporter [Corynebacterium sp.]|nr:MFS transporter [Corynebacterium sp.]